MQKNILSAIMAAMLLAGAMFFSGCGKEDKERLPGIWEYQQGSVERHYSWPYPRDTIIQMGDSPDIKKVVFKEDGVACLWRWNGAETGWKIYDTVLYDWAMNSSKDSIFLTSSELPKLCWKIHKLTKSELDISFNIYSISPEGGSSVRYSYLFKKSDSK
ncbi:MAG: hypothetical protein J6S82_00865 [Bacteroidales bacterium]|nr:hypothetical protein [Bacteroidales bacterium]